MRLKNKLSICLLSLFLSSNIFAQSSRLEERLNKRILKNENQDIYALLIAGTNIEDTAKLLAETSYRHLMSISNFYKSLISLNINPENLFILDEKGDKDKENTMPFYPVDGISNHENIEKTLNYLSSKIDKNDIFLLFLTGHGRNNSIKYYNHGFLLNEIIVEDSMMDRKFIIGDKELYGEELNNYLNCLSPKIGIIVGDFCYSGFLQDDLFRSNFIVISSAGKNEIADGFNGQTFGFYFAEGLKLNSSIGKVFDYARNKHKEKYHGKRRWGMNHTPIIHSLLNPDFIKIR